jgi:hypothetical protein
LYGAPLDLFLQGLTESQDPAFEKFLGLKFASSGEAEHERSDVDDNSHSPNQDVEMEGTVEEEEEEEEEEGEIKEEMVKLKFHLSFR